MKVPIEISARHVHFSESDWRELFGDHDPTLLKKLSQGEDFAAQETVKIVGEKGDFESVRVLGPFRPETQVEISYSDARKMGVDAPLKLSGDLPGVKVKIVCPHGEIERDACIVAKRHFHVSIQEATEAGLWNGNIVRASVLVGNRKLIFDDVVVRVREDYSASVHLDTDEGNAAGLLACNYCEVEK